jgi:hypothetical protein
MTAHDDLRIELVARAICEAEGRGPDQLVTTGELEVVRSDRTGVERRPKLVPLWQTKVDAARTFIACYDAIRER